MYHNDWVPLFSALRINSIPFKVEQIIQKLDERKSYANNWYHVARELGLSMDEANSIKSEEYREGGSPTNHLGECCYFKTICTCTLSIKATRHFQTYH